jgi:predicted ribosome quality control (RQC) complex YloA/Tae2 family protein
MALEDYHLKQITLEAAPLVTGQNVGRVFEPGPLELALAMRRGDNLCLYLSVLPSRPGLFLTDRSFKSLESERAPGNFTNLLRKYLAGATISTFEKEPNERRLRIDSKSFDVAGDTLSITLLIELTGRSANAHLFVGGAYLASLRDLPAGSLPPALSSKTPIKTAGRKIDPRGLEREGLESLLASESLKDVAGRFIGFSPTLVRELEARALHSSPFDALQSLLADLYERPAAARIYAPRRLEQIRPGEIDSRRNLILTYIDLTIAANLVENRFPTLNSAADSYFALLARIEAFHSHRNASLTKIKSEVSRLESLQAKLHEEMEEFSHADEYRRIGDLILANLATLRRADGGLFVIDFFDTDQPEIRVEADTGESPQQVAERYFKSYQRARRGLQAVNKRTEEVEKELGRKRKFAAAIAAAMTETELAEAESPILPPRPAKTKKTSASKGADKTKGVSLRRYLSSDGFEILVGRSDASNEELTFRIAKPADIWLHAADYPGPHVVIRNPERRTVPQRTLLEAAQLAAFFSKARNETSAAVRYSERKNISRPKKGKPGLALLTQFKTIMVSPKEAGQRLL